MSASDLSAVFGGNLIRLREARGWNHGEAAEAMGYARRTYRDLEEGKARFNKDHLEAAMTAFNVRIEDLLTSHDQSDGSTTRHLSSYEAWVLDTLRTQGLKELAIHALRQLQNPSDLPASGQTER